MSKLRTTSNGHRIFWCPGCNDPHQVNIDASRGHPCWDFDGNEENPTFSPSILVTYRHPKGYSNDNPPPRGYDGEYETDICHSFVKDGMIQYLGDCTHSMAGQTVPIPDWPYAPGKYGGLEE